MDTKHTINTKKIYIGIGIIVAVILAVTGVIFMLNQNKESSFSDDANNYRYIEKMNVLGEEIEELELTSEELFTQFGKDPINEGYRVSLAENLIDTAKLYTKYNEITATTRYEKEHQSLVEGSNFIAQVNEIFATSLGDLEFDLVTNEGAELLIEYTENIKEAEAQFNEAFDILVQKFEVPVE